MELLSGSSNVLILYVLDYAKRDQERKAEVRRGVYGARHFAKRPTTKEKRTYRSSQTILKTNNNNVLIAKE